MNYKSINFQKKLEKFDDLWAPKVIGEMNDYQFKVVKFAGDFVWHKHVNTDETFLVLKGKMNIEFRDGKVTIEEGEMYIVPKGVEHKPFTDSECHVMLIEPRGIVNTGDAGGELTAENDVWI
ncbi:MAG: cupin domain-containing protein [Bacteroidetes bacterium]|nr:cupin domain-containing protein [Bacteroidota bacterium]